jgi:hypothetical protein
MGEHRQKADGRRAFSTKFKRMTVPADPDRREDAGRAQPRARHLAERVGSAVVPVQTDSPDRDYLNLGAGASATLKGGVSAFLDYDVVLGRTNFTNHSFTGGVRIEF